MVEKAMNKLKSENLIRTEIQNAIRAKKEKNVKMAIKNMSLFQILPKNR